MHYGGEVFIKQFGEEVVPAMLKILDNSRRTWRQEYIAKTLLEESLKIKPNKIILDAFNKDFQYMEIAFKIYPKESEEILRNNAWVFAGQVLRVPSQILESEIEDLYYEVYIQCTRLETNYVTNFAKLRKSIAKSTKENKELRLALRKALIAHKALSSDSPPPRFAVLFATTAFNSGEIDGLGVIT